MLQEIQTLITQIENFLQEKEGFSAEVHTAGAVLKVHEPSGNEVQYDGYELLLYTLASRKLGHEIKLSVVKDEKGNDTFRINSGANYDIDKYIAEVNSTVLSKVKAKDVHAVVMSRQTGSVEFPYCINTFFEGGSWLRYDVTMPEMLYAAIHELPVEEQSDKSFAFTKLRSITETLRVEIEEFLKK